VGGVCLLVFTFFLILWGIHIALSSKDKFGTIIALGIVAIIFWQTVINVGMTTECCRW